MGQHDPESPLMKLHRYKTDAADRARTNEAAASYVVRVLTGVTVLTPAGFYGWLLFQQAQ